MPSIKKTKSKKTTSRVQKKSPKKTSQPNANKRAASQSSRRELAVGDKAPQFSAIDQHEQPISLSQFRGKKVILYFYPKDDTTGCTAEACSFRDRFGTFDGRDIVILGVSKDDAASHQRFIRKYHLPFRLIADTDGAICRAFGAYGPKMMYGRRYEGILRTTIIIDEQGRIAKIFRNVKPAGHADEVLAVA